MTDGAVCSLLLKPTAFVNEGHPGESKDQLRSCSDSQWLLCPEASSKTRKQPGDGSSEVTREEESKIKKTFNWTN